MCHTDAYHTHFSKCGHTRSHTQIYQCDEKTSRNQCTGSTGHEIKSSTLTAKCVVCEWYNSQVINARNRRDSELRSVDRSLHNSSIRSMDSSSRRWRGGSSASEFSDLRFSYDDRKDAINATYDRRISQLQLERTRMLGSLRTTTQYKRAWTKKGWEWIKI